jgi:hypothetical protein
MIWSGAYKAVRSLQRDLLAVAGPSTDEAVSTRSFSGVRCRRLLPNPSYPGEMKTWSSHQLPSMTRINSVIGIHELLPLPEPKFLMLL